MVDAIEQICEKVGFNELIKKKKKNIVKMVRFIFRVYESFYGEPTSPPEDVIKAVIRSILEVSPEVVHLRMKYSDVADRVLDRVIENIYRTAIKVLKEGKELKYIC